MLGHLNIKTTQVYSHLAPVSIADVETALTNPRGANVGHATTTQHFTPLRAV